LSKLKNLYPIELLNILLLDPNKYIRTESAFAILDIAKELNNRRLKALLEVSLHPLLLAIKKFHTYEVIENLGCYVFVELIKLGVKKGLINFQQVEEHATVVLLGAIVLKNEVEKQKGINFFWEIKKAKEKK